MPAAKRQALAALEVNNKHAHAAAPPPGFLSPTTPHAAGGHAPARDGAGVLSPSEAQQTLSFSAAVAVAVQN